MERRDILKLGALGVGVAVVSGCATTHSGVEVASVKPINRTNKKRVIIIGGGFAGLTVAKYIKIHNQATEVLVFESKNIFASCPYSNLWFGGVDGVGYESLLFSTLEPAKKYGYDMIKEKVVSIDRKNKTVSTLESAYAYDLLVIATGIEYDYSTFGLNEDNAKECYKLFPPSYSGGEEQLSLKRKIDEFNGGLFLITVPKNTYRCPPAPYERACMIANNFKKRGIKAKVVLLDPREKPTTKAKGFLSAFNELYKEYVEYLPSSNITKIDLKNKKVDFESFDVATKSYVKKTLAFDEANIIPTNRASKLLKDSGLALNDEGWARAKVPGFESLNDENIYIVGDALGEYAYPKSAQMAASCGAILGEQIAKRIKGEDAKVGSIMPSNVCYSMVSDKEAIAVNHYATYTPTGGVKINIELQENRDKRIGEATKEWYAGITGNIFG